MAAPAISSAVDALVSRVEAIVPTSEPGTLFRRFGERAPLTSRGGKRLFDVDFGALRDLSNEGAGVQAVGVADRTATVSLVIGYPLARAERPLEAVLAVDAELVLRALGRSATWAGTVVRRVVARASVDRSQAEVLTDAGPQPGHLYLVVACEITYRDTE